MRSGLTSHCSRQSYAALYGQERGVVVSLDQGSTFTLTDPEWSNFSVPACVHVHEGVLLAGSWEGLYRSDDGGATWTHDPSLGVVRKLVSLEGAIFAGLYPGGMLRSLDAGLTWSPVNAGLDGSTYINAIDVYGGTVYAARNVGTVVRWTGTAWVDAGLAENFIYTLVAAGNSLLAGTAFGEVFRTDDGSTWEDFSTGLMGGVLDAGAHSTNWDGRDDDGLGVSSGIYFARMRSGETSAAVKLVLVR